MSGLIRENLKTYMAVELSLESCTEFNYVERGASQVKKWA